FAGCERVYVLDIYAASEQPIAGVTSRRLVDRMRELGCSGARYAPSEESVTSEILAEAEPGLTLLTIGAGTVWRVADSLVSGFGELKTPQGTGRRA
ncbi:MAG: hypothetical protein ACRD19_00745, partial [Terriglobia bacterium]